MRSFLVRKINNFTKTLSLRAKVPNTFGARLYTLYTQHTIFVILYNLYTVLIDSQLYFDIMFHYIYKLIVQNKCALCTMFIVQRTAYTSHIIYVRDKLFLYLLVIVNLPSQGLRILRTLVK